MKLDKDDDIHWNEWNIPEGEKIIQNVNQLRLNVYPDGIFGIIAISTAYNDFRKYSVVLLDQYYTS